MELELKGEKERERKGSSPTKGFVKKSWALIPGFLLNLGAPIGPNLLG